MTRAPPSSSSTERVNMSGDVLIISRDHFISSYWALPESKEKDERSKAELNLPDEPGLLKVTWAILLAVKPPCQIHLARQFKE